MSRLRCHSSSAVRSKARLVKFCSRGRLDSKRRRALCPATSRRCRSLTNQKGWPPRRWTWASAGMLDALLRLYVDRLPDDVAAEEAAKFAGAALDDVHLLWAGGLEPGQPHYYRLHGPTILVEYDNTARDANHVHTVWRDPRGDFADDPLARHRAEHHH